MAGTSLIIEDKGFETTLSQIKGIEKLPSDEINEGLGRLFQASTRRRIRSTKVSPAGDKWQDNYQGKSTLFQSGALYKSIDYIASSTQTIIGSSLVYARIHQQGGRITPKSKKALSFMMGGKLIAVRAVNIPARPYIGLSDDDKKKALDMVEQKLQLSGGAQ